MYGILYRIREEHINGQISYGIEIWEDGVQIEYIPKVFIEKKHAEKLVDTCNEHQVFPIHIHDIIADMYFEIKNAAKTSHL